MKKIICGIFVFMFCLGLTGCGEGSSDVPLQAQAPHNAKVSILGSEDEIVKVEKMKREDADWAIYSVKNVEIAGEEFPILFYYFDEQGRFDGLKYSTLDDDEHYTGDKMNVDTVVDALTKMYGEPATEGNKDDNETFWSWEFELNAEKYEAKLTYLEEEVSVVMIEKAKEKTK